MKSPFFSPSGFCTGCRSARGSKYSKWLLLALIQLSACTPDRDASSVVEPMAQPIALPALAGISALTWTSDSTIAVLDSRGEPFVTLVDIVRDSVIAQGVRAGDGPGEVRHPTAMWRTRAGELVLFEPNQRRVMLVKDVRQPTQSQFVSLPVARAPGVLPPEGALLSGAGTLVTGQFGDTTVLFVPADPRQPQRVMLEGPNRRADVDPAYVFDANWHQFSVDEQTSRIALSFLFAPVALVMDSTGELLHEVSIGTVGVPRRSDGSIGPGFDVDQSDIASRGVSLRGHTLAIAYCGCLGEFVGDSTRQVVLYDLRDPARTARLNMPQSVSALALSADGQQLAVGFNNPEPQLRVFAVGDGAFKRQK